MASKNEDRDDLDKKDSYVDFLNYIKICNIDEFQELLSNAEFEIMTKQNREILRAILAIICENKNDTEFILTFVDFLAKKEPNQYWHNTALFMLCELFKDIENDEMKYNTIIRLLEDERTDPNRGFNDEYPFKEGNSIFMFVCFCNYSKLVTIMLESKRVNINKCDQLGNSILHYICHDDKYLNIFRILLEHNIDPNIINNNNVTALISACYGEVNIYRKQANTLIRNAQRKHNIINLKIIEELLNYNKTDPNICDKYGNTALHAACMNDNIGILNLLLKSDKVKANVYNEDGLTAFGVACENNSLEQIKFMFNDPNIDTNKCNIDGKSAFQLFCGDKYEVVKMLI